MNPLDRLWQRHLTGLDAAWEVRLGEQLLAARDAEREFSAASMVKTLLAALLADDLEAGVCSLETGVEITAASAGDGAGLLRFLPGRQWMALDELLLLMVAVSDNTATNALIESLGGIEQVNSRFAQRGWSSRLHRHAGDFSDPSRGLSSVSIAEHRAALASIADRGAFLAQQDRTGLARWLQLEAPFAHKTAAGLGARHDAGVLQTPRGELWVACFTDGGPQAEYVDHPACVAMGAALRETLLLLELGELVAG